MSGRNPFDQLTGDFTPERRLRLGARKAAPRAAMTLRELRRARAMTQKAVGDALNVNQPAVARLERRTDMHISSLRAYIEVLGGRLTIVAEFPQGSVVITNFSGVGEDGESQ
ncbi:MAG: XRE family transcriptional regulator [Defluviicoccus sp.]|nr:XRE family transcriptional regulator [Defluviicoccus sp.]